MLRPHHGFTGALCVLGLMFSAACATRVPATAKQTPTTIAAPRPFAAPAPQPISDPVVDLIALSTTAFPERSARAAGRPSRNGQVRVQRGARGAARLAVRRPDGAAHPRAVRSPRRAHQRLRGDCTRPGRRVHRQERRRAGQHRRHPRAVDVRAASDLRDDRSRRRGSQRDGARHRHPAEHKGAVVRRAVQRPAEGPPGRGTEPRRSLPADDPGGLPRRGSAARPGVRAADRERLQAERRVTRQGEGHLAVHAGYRRSRTA